MFFPPDLHYPTKIFFPLFWVFSLFLLRAVQAHEGFEVTAVARLQHHRLEVTATLSLQMGGILLGEGNNPEFELNANNFETNQPRLQAAARDFYEVTAGGETLIPLNATAELPNAEHLRLTVIYPEPASWPLKFRTRKMGGLPASAISELQVYDQNERLLGGKLMMPQDPAASELSVDPAAPVFAVPAISSAPAEPPPGKLPVLASDDSPASSRKLLSWLNIAIGMALALVLLLVVLVVRKNERSPTL